VPIFSRNLHKWHIDPSDKDQSVFFFKAAELTPETLVSRPRCISYFQKKGLLFALQMVACRQQKTGFVPKGAMPARSLSENSVVGPRASVFSSDKDGEAGDVGSIVDTAGCRQAGNKPLEARSSSPTGSQAW